jgi:anti-anti-sigma regulatory factor
MASAASFVPSILVIMAVRITSRSQTHRFVVCVHGTLDQPASALLRAEIEQAPEAPLVIDLSQLVTFDEAGLTLLRALAAAGARLEGASPYVKLRLAPDGGAPVRRPPPE